MPTTNAHICSGGLTRRVLICVVGIATWLTGQVHAADCPDMTRYAKDVYTQLKETGRELGCYAPFDAGLPFSPPAATGCDENIVGKLAGKHQMGFQTFAWTSEY